MLEGKMDRKNYPPTGIHNTDETGLPHVQSKAPDVISPKGKRQVGLLSQKMNEVRRWQGQRKSATTEEGEPKCFLEN
ncbi:hypothetical protein PR048_004890 [Dryococelus australis]|uniref:Uncharacterized protein n=1 Tax=Dryococelus australis TaxID=614101 RepID=A0ABQ9I6Q5_9NEOP|nr:hypothetical protein PR048_004890 [Dryococelus australis]